MLYLREVNPSSEPITEITDAWREFLIFGIGGWAAIELFGLSWNLLRAPVKQRNEWWQTASLMERDPLEEARLELRRFSEIYRLIHVQAAHLMHRRDDDILAFDLKWTVDSASNEYLVPILGPTMTSTFTDLCPFKRKQFLTEKAPQPEQIRTIFLTGIFNQRHWLEGVAASLTMAQIWDKKKAVALAHRDLEAPVLLRQVLKGKEQLMLPIS